MLPTVEKLKSVISYDPDTGEFTWLVSLGNRAKVGDRAGGQNTAGYLQLQVLGKFYYGHRLAWFFMTGCFPKSQIDHRNGIRNDNRWSNLREATTRQNGQNRVRPVGAAGLIGASRHRSGWTSEIHVGGRKTYLGRFKTPEEASAAYAAAKTRLHMFQPVDRRLLVAEDH